MRKRLLTVLAVMVMVLTMIPATAFGQPQEVEINFEAYSDYGIMNVEYIYAGEPGEATETNGYGTDQCVVGNKINEYIKSIDIRPNGYGPFEGWIEFMLIEGPEGETEYDRVSDTIYTTDEVLAMEVPDYNVAYVAKWESMELEDYFNYSDDSDDGSFSPDVSVFAFSANGGILTFKNLMNGQNNAHNTFDCVIDAGTLETCLRDFPAAFVSADRPGYVHTGWTVYEADRIEFASVEESIAEENGGSPPYGDPNLEFFLYDMYMDAGVKMHTYIGLWYGKIIDTDMSTEELYQLGGNGKSYYAVPNWSKGEIQTIKVNGKDARLEISEEIATVDPALAHKFNSVDALKAALKKNAFKANSSFTKDGMKIKYMDIVLKIQQDDGTWVVATPENFPKGGLEVTIPYPEGTKKDGYKFSVLHMFTHGNKAGDIEILKPEKKKDGLHVVVTSLSPFAVPYEEAEDVSNSGHKMGSESGLLVLFLMTVAAAGITSGTIMVRRKAKAAK